MPENENKELNPQEIAEQRRIAQEKAIKPVETVPTTTAVVQGPSEAEQAITNAYDNSIKNTELLIKGWEGRKANAVQQDEVAQRKSRNMQIIAGLSDGLASLANLIGVADRGTNIDMGTGALTPFQQKMEAARLERKADIKSIDDRLEQYRQQLLNLQLAKGKGVAQQKAKEADAAKVNARFREEMAYKKGRDKITDAQFQQKIDAMTEDRKQKSEEFKKNYNLALQRLSQESQEKGLTGSFPVLVGENEMLDIPKNEINNATIGRIFEQLPKEFKDLAQGKPQYKYEDDGFGNSIKTFAGYAPATLEEKLAAIGAAARTDKTIQDELRKLAGTYKPEQKTKQGTQSVVDDDDDFSSYMIKPQVTPVSMDYRDNLPGGVAIPLRR